MDNLKRKERIFLLHQPTPLADQHEMDCNPMTQLQGSPMSSMRYGEGETAPGWWFRRFEPVWRPFIQRLCRQKKMTLLEFERTASQVPGLTHVEKTIAISAFRQQQEQGLVLLHNTTALHREHNLSAV